MKRKLDIKKLYIKYGNGYLRRPAQEPDHFGFMICYIGEGQAAIPPSLFSRLMLMPLPEVEKLLDNPRRVLYEAIKHSQYIDFEPVR